MEASQRDTTDDWRITPTRAPATVVELEGRIDLALSTARVAEEAALEIGAASLEAAEQARRAATLAERASVAAARAAADVAAGRAYPPRVMAVEPPAPPAAAEQPPPPAPAPEPVPAPVPPPSHINGAGPRRPDPFDERITAFRERAEKVMIRLQKLEAVDPPGTRSGVARLR
jgi:colicin import membrane protein